MKAEVEITVGDYTDVRVSFSYIIENNGIGPYEFWGYRGFDEGEIYDVVESIDCIDERLTDEERAHVNALIRQNFSRYSEKVLSEYGLSCC